MSLKRILLWGGKSQALLFERMIVEAGLGEIFAVFDATLERPYYKSTGLFINEAQALREVRSSIDAFVVCIGGEYGYARHMTAVHLGRQGLAEIDLIHPHAYIDPSVDLGVGVQVMPNVTVNSMTRIGRNCLLNTSCTIDHECEIGDGVHVMGGAAIAGKVTIGSFATIGTNATILPFLKVGEGAFVGAGAVVTRDVAPLGVVCGVPAKTLRTNSLKFDVTQINTAFG